MFSCGYLPQILAGQETFLVFDSAILFVSFLFGCMYSVKELAHIKYIMIHASNRLFSALLLLCHKSMQLFYIK